MAALRIDCRRCRHYFVTWDEDFPHGCRRMGFKSRRAPNDEVRCAMHGRTCRLFEQKQNPAAGPRTPAR
ncbi:MAG: uracil-DNA glycosylase [Desulfobacterales bacterium]|jgi:hypothetical protein|nr:uracil-DNA glycosylase [Desulfobacterales bacterium]